MKRLYNSVFSKKDIVLVSNDSIKNYQVSSSVQILLFVLCILNLLLFVKSWYHYDVITAKNDEIINLRKANYSFSSEVNSLNAYLVKIDQYFNSISDFEHIKNKAEIPETSNLSIDKFNEIFGAIKFDNTESKIANNLIKAKILEENIAKSVKSRINNIEKTLLITGIDFPDGHLEKDMSIIDNRDVVLLSEQDNPLKGQGGPLQEKYLLSNNSNFGLIKAPNNNQVTYLNNLENLVDHMPISKPMKNYYISSNYGKRLDPITNRYAMHRGTDFVGSSLNEKIISPSSGKVVFAGKFYDYGNMITIDHGFDIQTRYAHLKKIKVRKGDVVEKGQVIGLQGNTGRSTGHHLHYEVRYQNKPIDPKKFLKVGTKIFQDINKI